VSKKEKSSQSITFSTKNTPQISPNSEMWCSTRLQKSWENGGFGGGQQGPSWTPTFTRAQPVDGLLQLLSQRFVCDVFTENSQQAHQGHSFHHLATNKTNKNWSFGKNSWTTGGEKSYLERERVMMTTL